VNVSSRSIIIAESGILPVLRRFIIVHPTNSSTSNHANKNTMSALLSPIHVEFLQACIYAGHYRYAQRSLCHRYNWPRPTTTAGVTVTVQHVLRYYYLRGIVHLACRQYLLARRCFWICCCIPGELCSAISIAAWKKMVLVTCRIQATMDTNAISPLQLPPAAPPCLVKFLSQAYATPGSSKNSMQQQQYGAGSPSFLSHLQQQDASSTLSSPLDQGDLDGIMAATAASASGGGGGATEEASSVMHMVDVEAAASMNMAPPEDVLPVGQQQQLSSSQQQQQQQQQPHPHSYHALGVSVYAQLTNAFGHGDYALYQSLLQQHAPFLQADGNYGLALQIGGAGGGNGNGNSSVLRRRQVYLWSRVYSEMTTIELTQLLQLSSVPETLELLVQMSLDTTYGPWPIQILDHGRIVVFPKWNVYTQYHDSDDDVDDEDDKEHDTSTNDNETLVQDLVVLTNMMQQLDATLAASAKFQSITARRNSNTATGGGGGAGAGGNNSKEMSLSSSFLTETASSAVAGIMSSSSSFPSLSSSSRPPRGVEDV
jgi:hypothetical protein